MSKIKDVTKFVNEVFDMYGLNKFGFFYDYDEGEYFEIPLFLYNKMDDDTLNRISIKLGLTKEEIINRDMVAAKRYWNKYPFFHLYSEYLSQWSWDSRYGDKKPTAEEILLNAIFGDGKGVGVKERYDYQNVIKRLNEQLIEFDKLLPGTYHANAKMTNLTIDTEVFISFPQITEMIKSFIDMVEYVKTGFFKAVKLGLEDDEINEYNFLVNYLNANDVVMPSVLVTYDNVCIYRQAYLEEPYEDFYSYVKIRNFVETAPWRCKEFLDNMELVREFVDIFPETKAEMRRFAVDVSQFSCFFVWSDAKPIVYSPEEEALLSDINKVIGEEDIPLEERAKEPTHVYVPKKKKEMFDWAPYVDKLNQVTKPVTKGGLKIRERSPWTLLPEGIPRIQRRIEVKNGGNKR